MHIRPLRAADAAPSRTLMLQAYADAPDAFTSTPEERAAEPLAWWERRIGNVDDPAGRGAAFGAFVDGELAGVAALECNDKPKTRHKALLIGMFVDERCRGLGAGAALVRAVLDHARARPGLSHVTLTVTEGNEPALRLYRACGFEAFGVEPMAIRTPRGLLGKVHMWCPLHGEPMAA